MAVVKFRGKERTHISVGKGGSFDYSNPQSAWDAITDSAAEKPYLISLEPGVYEQASPTDGEPAWWFKNKTDITIVGSRAAVLKKTGTTGGGTVAIGEDGGLADRIRLSGFTIVNPLDGNTDGGPPEAGLFIGTEGEHPTTLPYDNIEIENMHILGVHDGIQFFGTMAPGTDSGPERPPRVWVRNNWIESCHDAYTIKGGLQLHSEGNQIHVKSDGINPWLTSIDGWKNTGIHYNVVSARSASIDRGRAFYNHLGDRIYVESNGNVAQGAMGSQRKVAGVLFYSSGSDGLEYPDCVFDGCSIKVVNLANEVVGSGFAGFYIEGIADIADGEVTFCNGSIDVHQRQTASNAPAIASGVFLDLADVSSVNMRVLNSFIRVRNDKSASPLAYSMRVNTSGQTIRHNGIVPIAADGIDETNGAITNVGDLA